MKGNLISKQLAKKLNEKGKGNCPYDSGCNYGIGGKKCAAPKEYLLNQFEKIKNEPDPDGPKPGFFMQGNLEAAWPCATCIQVIIEEPTRPDRTASMLDNQSLPG
jgi:hypothetical protein